MAKCKNCGDHGMMLKVNDAGLCLSCVTKAYQELEAKVTPDLLKLQDVSAALAEMEKKLSEAKKSALEAQRELKSIKNQIIAASEIEELESFSLYEPRFSFVSSDEYKARLDEIREKQKAMIKAGTAATCSKEWKVEGSTAKGKAFISEMIKLFLRSFNNECDIAVGEVKFSNYGRSVSRIEKSFDTINKLGKVNAVSLTDDYKALKLEELALAYEYQCKKQEEKEALAELRAQQREEAKLAKEIEAARKEAEKERKHYLQALEKINLQLQANPQNADLLEKRDDLMNHIDDISCKLEDIDYRQSNQRAGYVYVISNIGSFGEGVYKIGMTRRLDPMERVYELGDASVPFRFDVHAMIFSDDAPKLEAALHQAFADKRVNQVNTRREYFRVSLEEIKAVVRENHDKTVEFVNVPEAQQYRESIRLK